MKRTASAVWNGDLKQGKGTLSAPGGVLNNTPYSFTTRFENGVGTNPEELIAAAHAGCFTMALSATSARPASRQTSSRRAPRSTSSRSVANGRITPSTSISPAACPASDAAKFEEIAADAKAKCPVLARAQSRHHAGRKIGERVSLSNRLELLPAG
jgi:osmotically inducible protein OsmC